jgi:hypothetical protein
VLPGRDFNPSAFKVVDVPAQDEALIELTRVRDGEFHEQSFRLSAETRLHVYAIGEMSNSRKEFADYGAIQDAATGDVVWEMTFRNTDHAGGADKNRMFDGIVTLAAGMYTAFYVTDGSHAYGGWNASPPFDRRSYGLSIYPAGDSRPPGFELVSGQDLLAGTDVLARVIRVGDDERRRARFTLDKDGWVHIYALGEGSDGRMYDYAYIIDLDRDRDVWEMTYRRTDRAGGAKKNRLYDDEIKLSAGEYEVVYESDGSHSFDRWNASPPKDPLNWGVTVSRADR